MNEKLLANLEGNITILKDFIGKIPEDAILKRRRPDVWTIYEHLEHMSGAQVMLLRRIEMFFNEEKPVITPFIPPDKPVENTTKPVEHLLGTFAKYRMKQLDAVKKAPDPLWEKKALHPEYSEYSFDTLVRHACLHDSFHMYRIEELWLQNDAFLKAL
jgi:hypothetical protein